MPTRMPLLLALLTAGLLTGEGLTEARSGDVFVPELAALEGAVCGRPALPGPGPLPLPWSGDRRNLDLAKL